MDWQIVFLIVANCVAAAVNFTLFIAGQNILNLLAGMFSTFFGIFLLVEDKIEKKEVPCPKEVIVRQ